MQPRDAGPTTEPNVGEQRVHLPVSCRIGAERPCGRRIRHQDPERLDEPRVLVDLVLARTWERDGVGEKRPAGVRLEAEAPSRAPLPGGQRRLE